MDKRKVVDRIQKLLNLANSDNENEAKAAAAAANKLLTKHNLSMQDCSESKEYDESVFVERARLSQLDKWILPLLRDFYFVTPLVHSKQVGKTATGRRKFVHLIKILGEETNVDIARYMFDFFQEEFHILWRKYAKENKATARSKDSYFHGLVWGIKEQLKVVQAEAQTETGLMIVKDEDLDRFVDGLYPNLKTNIRKSNVGDTEA